jgi:hypothetical protein
MTDVAIRVEGLTKRFGSVMALAAKHRPSALQSVPASKHSPAPVFGNDASDSARGFTRDSAVNSRKVSPSLTQAGAGSRLVALCHRSVGGCSVETAVPDTTRDVTSRGLGQCCSYVNSGSFFSVLKTVRASCRFRQRSASRRLLPSLCLRSR